MHSSKIKNMIITIVAVLGIVVGWQMVEPQQVSAAEPTYTFATNNTFEPFEIQDSKGGYSGKNPGIEIEMLKKIAKHEHVKYELKSLSCNGGLRSLEAGKVDAVIAVMSLTDERIDKDDFSTHYYTSGVVMAVAKDSNIMSMIQLKGQPVSPKSGTSAALFLKNNQMKY